MVFATGPIALSHFLTPFDKEVIMKPRNIIVLISSFLAVLMLGTMAAPVLAADDVPRISKEDLKNLVDAGADVAILDVRHTGDWKTTDIKIKGAERADPRDFSVWASRYPRDKKLVLYCA